MIVLRFVAGTIEVRGLEPGSNVLPGVCMWDPREHCYRAPALAYAGIIRVLHQGKLAYEDQARAYQVLETGVQVQRVPRPYQQEAIETWKRWRGRGVVVLPTGAGKTHVAVMAIDDKRRSTLVIAPTLDLVRQWYDLLRVTFKTNVGVVGGGDYDVQDLTVITYDSAYQHMEHLGAKFGLIIFDECHHLPGPTYGLAARFCLAPFRLGLTATPERADGRERELVELIGPTVYRKELTELSGEYLAEYETIRLVVDLSDEEREEYEEQRGFYRNYLKENGISVGSPTAWSQFVQRASQSDVGRAALAAYRRQRELALAAPAKFEMVEHLLRRHHNDRLILFTQNNATAYAISKRFLIPVITHQTKVKERSHLLEGFNSGLYTALVTSKVLNEGVDVPEANVAIVISGSGSVMEHVQRLGRILRKKGDKRATLYELVSAGTVETFTSNRRREHVAYR
jgi:superfamily II DNA or RNA helicase